MKPCTVLPILWHVIVGKTKILSTFRSQRCFGFERSVLFAAYIGGNGVLWYNFLHVGGYMYEESTAELLALAQQIANVRQDPAAKEMHTDDSLHKNQERNSQQSLNQVAVSDHEVKEEISLDMSSQVVTEPDGLEMITLASSSKGNAVLVRTKRTNILVDAGISAKRIKQSLAQVGIAPEQLDAIFITHEHSDHISGLAQLLKQYSLPVYTAKRTWAALGEVGIHYARCFHELQPRHQIGDLEVERFAISHDAVEPYGYCFNNNSVRGAICTDLGYISQRVEKMLQDTELLVLEANHDPERLRQGPYAPYLKHRILGTKGHLANVETGRLLSRLYKGKPLQVILAHRSETNNTEELVEKTISSELREQGIIGSQSTIYWQHGAVYGNVRIASRGEKNAK